MGTMRPRKIWLQIVHCQRCISSVPDMTVNLDHVLSELEELEWFRMHCVLYQAMYSLLNSTIANKVCIVM